MFTLTNNTLVPATNIRVVARVAEVNPLFTNVITDIAQLKYDITPSSLNVIGSQTKTSSIWNVDLLGNNTYEWSISKLPAKGDASFVFDIVDTKNMYTITATKSISIYLPTSRGYEEKILSGINSDRYKLVDGPLADFWYPKFKLMEFDIDISCDNCEGINSFTFTPWNSFQSVSWSDGTIQRRDANWSLLTIKMQLIYKSGLSTSDQISIPEYFELRETRSNGGDPLLIPLSGPKY